MGSKRKRSEPEQRFYRAWQACQARGQCDSWNTTESRRVYREWISAGRPALVQRFIRLRANIGAEAKP